MLAGSAFAADRPRPDGALLEQAACGPNSLTSYESYVAWRTERLTREIELAKGEGIHLEIPKDGAPLLPSREEFAERVAYKGFECRRITYASDGLAVKGYLWKPMDTTGKKLPLVIFNRGGNREFGALVPWMYQGFHRYLASGFVVLGSQYRGNDGGEGREEFGGADVRDVLNLIPLAKSLGYVDMGNVFMLGWSRGGMMTLLALKAGMRVNAAAIGGTPTDLSASARDREAMVHVYQALIPGFDKHGEEALRKRSAVFWPERINVPLLILHGGADWRVKPSHALALAQRLQALGKTYELVIHAGDDHGLSRNDADTDRRIIAWFQRHRK